MYLTITLNISDLDLLAHALLLAKVDYTLEAVKTEGEMWKHRMRNVEALQLLYDQIEAALAAQKVEA